MAGGFREIVINTQERAISPDINRLQKFKGRDFAELLRYMLDAASNDDIDAGANIIEVASSTSPLTGEIINGLQPTPQNGSTAVFVSAGVAMLIQPDGSADDSVYKYVRDAGRGASNPLAIAANAGGSIRVDILEVQIDSVPEVVVDSRDVYNPVTGLFTAASMIKETQSRLSYRVRQGTIGGGWPGTATGWMPLMVAVVPAGSSNNDTCTFWDVRPLISDREFGPFKTGLQQPKYADMRVETSADTIDLQTFGALDIRASGRRMGGQIRRTAPGTDDPFWSANAASSTDPTYALTVPAHVYVLFPGGLPRWARYTDASSGARKPRAPRGLLVSSAIKPDRYGRPSTPITLPAAYGFLLATQDGVHVTALPSNGAQHGSTSMDGEWVFAGDVDRNFALSRGVTLTPTYFSGSGIIQIAIPTTAFPNQAKGLELRIFIQVTVPASTTYTFNPQIGYQSEFGGSSFGRTPSYSQTPYMSFPNVTGAPLVVGKSFLMRLPVAQSPAGPIGYNFSFDFGAGLTVAVTAVVTGYKL